MMDKKLTSDMQAFLQKTEPTDQDIRDAAMLLLRINRNRLMYNNIMRRPSHYLPKLTYELKKHLRYRLEGFTLDEVRKLDAEVMPKVKEFLSQKRGKRADHDSLPDNIKALWDENTELWKKVEQNYNTCLSIDMPCDRFEYLVPLKEGYEKCLSDLALYDAYDPNAPTETPEAETKTAEEVVTDNVKTITNARAYISKNRDKYVTLSQGDDTDKAAELKQKIQERVNALVACNATIDEDTAKWLSDNGFKLD